MRMVSYFGFLTILIVPALLGTAITGLWLGPSQTHLGLGLVAAILTVAAHSLVILFMIITGRVQKAAMESRTLDPAFLEELNQFFARKAGYPVALLGALFIVATGVLGYGQRGFGLPSEVHMLFGLATVAMNLWAFVLEFRLLRENQVLLDKTAAELDRLDAERGEELPLDTGEPMRFSPSGRWVAAGFTSWVPLTYWTLVVWRASFDRVSPVFLLGTILVSLLCFVCAWLTRGLSSDSEPASSVGS